MYIKRQKERYLERLDKTLKPKQFVFMNEKTQAHRTN